MLNTVGDRQYDTITEDGETITEAKEHIAKCFKEMYKARIEE
jgi:hypothetical protein